MPGTTQTSSREWQTGDPWPLFDMAAPVYCVCQTPDEGGREMIECTRASSGCGGWIHAECFRLTPQEREEALSADDWACPWCRGVVPDVPALHAYARGITEEWLRSVAEAAAVPAAKGLFDDATAAAPTPKKRGRPPKAGYSGTKKEKAEKSATKEAKTPKTTEKKKKGKAAAETPAEQVCGSVQGALTRPYELFVSHGAWLTTLFKKAWERAVRCHVAAQQDGGCGCVLRLVACLCVVMHVGAQPEAGLGRLGG